MATEILVYGDIGIDVRAAEFLRALRRAEAAGEEITVRINSLGGDVFEGVAIANAVAACETEIQVVIDAVAASAASMIAISAAAVAIAADAFIMIHQPWAMTIGDAVAHKRACGLLNRLSAQMAKAYADRIGASVDKAQSLMAAETWFDASEAVAARLADRILPARDGAALGRAGARYKRTPAALAARVWTPARKMQEELELVALRLRI